MNKVREVATAKDYVAAAVWCVLSEIPPDMAEDVLDRVDFSADMVRHMEDSGLSCREVSRQLVGDLR